MNVQLNEHKQAVAWSYEVLGLTKLPETENIALLEKALAAYLNDLIVQDFNKLIGILYRIDISQEKAVAELAACAEQESAGETMARMIISRQEEKIHFRRLYSK